MWSITSYYNPLRYKRRLENYRVFRENLKTPLVTVELSFDGEFELKNIDADVLVQISGGAIVWQKEKLLNIAIKSVPREERSVAWIDCDIVFDRHDWMNEAEARLAAVNVVQLYSDVVDLSPAAPKPNHNDRTAPLSAQGFVSVVKENHLNIKPLVERGRSVGGLSMGLAWAARKSLLKEHGLYEAMIIGSGDRLMVGTIYGEFQKIIDVFNFNQARQKHYLRWARPFHEAVDGRVEYVSGRIYHLWHGESANRKALERHRLFAGFDFDPGSDLAVGPNGAWHWARSRPVLEEFFIDYFKGRAEDG